ncbi:acyl-CoA thioesterase [Polymorphobacter fuscus]|uniref:Acyl-CoA thioesterase n=1 Tax=Sandarakinorhabdus fusca TaxID=1439888 RepID=A0A7C9KXX6_9SPHN|nr:acyl-CoA thioesterase [Polymorphobacter fuscus]KAB7644387.1 acyl-CoA thioesterase [Polymorphobacter fuscus]MQT18305.1 acyl-CoA thioesterase [Polymorphobacter fuscus]NJC08201.1 acyl-CoA thioester hydrolase [Polymorphobacter fuscus]
MKADPRRHDLAAYPWSVVMETRFADMDVNRHLNNVAITRFFEEARIRFNWHLISPGKADARPRYLVAHVAVDYLGEGAYPAPVTMTYAVGGIGRSSFRCLMGMFQNGACIALCDSVLVHRGPDGPAPLPEELRIRLEAFPLAG